MGIGHQLFYQKSSITDVAPDSKYAPVYITLHLTFLEKYIL